MSLLVVLLALAACLHQGVGNKATVATLSTDLPNIQKEIISKHNDLRKRVVPSASNMLKMVWNGTAAKNAKRWADQCMFDHSPEEERTIENGLVCGENLFYSSAPTSWSDAIQSWFDEKDDFIYGEGPKDEDLMIGHYTQLVWYKSFMLACAFSSCDNEEYPYYYVCQYCPAGNIEGIHYYTPYAEGKPCGDCPNNCDGGLCTNPCLHQDDLANCPSLKEQHSCNHEFVKKNCPASCQCTTEIQ
ncbi:cysteine-rich venom protein pseudechetoxin-like [Rhineura floridana]|uniref:cysteine-rich venom protein pseudechetoxin-like n=1 Tax=Rhineura floridana TaxID=261503 RepID=UPI002AC83A9B|nr:cysteine-rich venom protein pseudechetoxin-like [Rhineura floridana]